MENQKPYVRARHSDGRITTFPRKVWEMSARKRNGWKEIPDPIPVEDPVMPDPKEILLNELRATADRLGIKYRQNWGIPKLTKEIDLRRNP